ncbi:MAG: archaeal heat shock protein Hsp20 [Candidatus Bathyarchaeia archaeon]
MSDRWWKRKEKRHRSPWFNLFDEFDRLEEMMDEMMHRSFDIPSERRELYGPYVYGFSMSMGPDGKPVIREFGNLQKSRFGPKVREEREPLIDVMEEDEDVVVVAELPGVDRDDIDLRIACDELVISVNTSKRRFHKELRLPAGVEPNSAQTSYKNGVLEVRLKKILGEKSEEIFVE